MTRFVTVANLNTNQFDLVPDSIDVVQINGTRYKELSLCKENIGIFNGIIYYAPTKWCEGDFAEEAGAVFSATPSTGQNVVVHFKLPLRCAPDAAPQMYRLHFKGYSYGGGSIIDTIVSGYAYTDGNIHKKDVIGTHVSSITQYVGEDKHIYIRFVFKDSYYTTLSIDSMAVGNGLVLPSGSITAIFSDKDVYSRQPPNFFELAGVNNVPATNVGFNSTTLLHGGIVGNWTPATFATMLNNRATLAQDPFTTTVWAASGTGIHVVSGAAPDYIYLDGDPATINKQP